MHPILSDKKRVFIYFVVWGILGSLSGYSISLFNGMHPLYSIAFAVPMMLIFGEVALSSWYLCRAFPLERNSIIKIILVSLSSVVLISSSWSLLGWGWMYVIEQTFSIALSSLRIYQSLLIIFGMGVQLFLISLALNYLIVAFERSKESERAAYEARILAQNAELKSLRMQIDPHFLFNSLNSISALTSTNSEQARTMTTTLADFFRKSLSYGSKEKISLREELSLLDHYLEIELIRFGKRLQIQRQIDPESLNCLVPPLILQPLVENAIKHGISNNIEGGMISIQTQKKNNRLFITIENPIDQDVLQKKGARMGMEIVRKRLTTLFGTDGDLKIATKDNTFQVIIFMPGLEKNEK